MGGWGGKSLKTRIDSLLCALQPLVPACISHKGSFGSRTQKSLCDHDVDSLRMFRTPFDAELYHLPWPKGLGTLGPKCGNVEKYIWATLAFNETIACTGIERLDRANKPFTHFALLLSV